MTWYGIGDSSPRALYVTAGLATLVAIPAAWSIGPYILVVAVLQVVMALVLQQSFRWWKLLPIIGVAIGVWTVTIAVAVVLTG